MYVCIVGIALLMLCICCWYDVVSGCGCIGVVVRDCVADI